MDVATMAAALGCSHATAARYHAAFTAAMIQAEATSLRRAAMWCAQLGHESAGLRYMREIWGPTPAQRRYEGRRDLGNIHPGDGKRFAGHGPIQITGRANHSAVSRWAHAKGYVPTPTYFVDHPDELAGERYGFLGPVWYWTVARPTINSLCDKGAVTAVTRLINGGTNGLADRIERWNRCLRLGNAILPDTRALTGGVSTAQPAPKPVPAGPPLEGDDLYITTPMPPTDDDGTITTPKHTWPTVRIPFAFEPGSGLLKVDHGGRGGWLHLGRWWVRRRDWSANTPFHDPQDHPVGPNGSERFVGYGWVTGAPAGADMIELVLSAPDGVHIQWWRTR